LIFSFVRAENQFFIAGTEGKGPISNVIGLAIAERVISAAKSGQKFKVP
jgi:phospholipase D1/2